MADFFSQFQVHPPTPPAGFDPNTGIAPRQDFSLGGFAPAPPSNTPQIGDPRYGVGGMGYEGGMGGGSYLPIGQMPLDSGFGVNDIKNGTGANPYGGGNAWSDPRLSPLPQPWQQGPGGWAGQGTDGPLPGTHQIPPIPQSPYQNDWTPRGPNGLPDPRIISGPAINGGNAQLGPAAQMGPNGPTYTNGQGQATDQFGNPMGTSNQTGQVNLGPLVNGIGQPMNPSQQSGMVLMRSPDGLHMQNVPQAHVDHYTGLGATQVTGPQLTGSSYGGGY